MTGKKAMGKFSIDAAELEWINKAADDPEDLCLHGRATAVIGERELSYDETTVSAAALYLLKTLTEDHIINEGNQLLPHCGFFLIPNKYLTDVVIEGCCYGVDWSVIHEGDKVRLVLKDGYEVSVPLKEYKAEVFRFADKIEAFYSACSPKKLPEDEFDRNGYTAFWNEWRRRRYGTLWRLKRCLKRI